jgi:predicted Zn-dependent protease
MKAHIALFICALILASCATNPVTGRREFMVVSEQQEQALGDQAHPQVIEQFGIYDEKPELNRMVDQIGRQVAAVSDRPDLKWRFTLLDTPMVNAMALPGGYIYVTRGILERMNSEDELAGVIAHEIAHVTGRHAAQRISQSQLAQLGMMVGSILAGPAATQAYGSLVQLGAGLLFQRYSRQQETQADLLGTAYMTEAGFNPVGAEQMLQALQRLEKGEVSSLERYFVDHPDPAKRVREVQSQIANLRTASPSIGTSPIEREPFLTRLDGMITGNSTLQTTIRDNVVYQRRYGIILPVPEGWVGRAGTGDLFAMSPPKVRNTAFVAQEVPVRKLQGFRDAQSAIRAQLQKMGLRYRGSTQASTRTGERFAIDVWSGGTSSGSVMVESTQFVEGDQVVVFLMLTPATGRSASVLASMLGRMSIDRGQARTAQPARMEIGKVRPADDNWSEIAARATGSSAFAEQVAAINGFDVRNPPPQGLTVKLPREVIAD